MIFKHRRKNHEKIKMACPNINGKYDIWDDSL